MPRKDFPRKIKAAIIKRAAGRCEACKAVLKPGEGDVDHILPDALGGKPDAANGRLICKVCHAAKTAIDVGRIRKADRQRDKGTGAIKPKGSFARAPKQERPDGKTLPPRRPLFVKHGAWPITGHSESGD